MENEEQLLRLLGIDCWIVTPQYIEPDRKELPDGTYYGVFGSHRMKVVNKFSTYDEYASFPLAKMDTLAQGETYSRWPDGLYWDWTTLPHIISEVNQEARYHIRYDIGGIFLRRPGAYIGWINFLSI
ncbi:MAG: hypothetical protein Q7J07_01025 [Pelolinea sp.]|nr:hypothetical protein [Pelolinea sp.]